METEYFWERFLMQRYLCASLKHSSPFLGGNNVSCCSNTGPWPEWLDEEMIETIPDFAQTLTLRLMLLVLTSFIKSTLISHLDLLIHLFSRCNMLIPIWLLVQCTRHAWLRIVWKVAVSNFPGYCQSRRSIPSAVGIEDTFIVSKVIWGKYV